MTHGLGWSASGGDEGSAPRHCPRRPGGRGEGRAGRDTRWDRDARERDALGVGRSARATRGERDARGEGRAGRDTRGERDARGAGRNTGPGQVLGGSWRIIDP